MSNEGKGAGKERAREFVDKLYAKLQTLSSIQHLEEVALVCDRIDRDMISDITIALIRAQLIEFTQFQEYNIPILPASETIAAYDNSSQTWKNITASLPHVTGSNFESRPIILIPEKIVKDKLPYNYKTFYLDIAVKEYERIALNENHPSIERKNNGEMRVVRKRLMEDERFKLSKNSMTNFISEHPESLSDFRKIVTTRAIA